MTNFNIKKIKMKTAISSLVIDNSPQDLVNGFYQCEKSYVQKKLDTIWVEQVSTIKLIILTWAGLQRKP